MLAFVAPRFAARLFLFPQADDNSTARTMGRLFGVRDAALGALALTTTDPKVSAHLHRVTACVDAGDAVAGGLMLRSGRAKGASIAMLGVAVSAVISGLLIARGEDERASRG